MSYFNSNITGGSGGAAGGLVTKFMKTIAISSSALAEVTIDISHDITNYKNITNDNIIIELNNASAITAGDSELSHTYDAETGIITITSTNSNIPFASSSAVELDVNIYVAGAVQLPTVSGKFNVINGSLITNRIQATSNYTKVAYALDLPIGKDLLVYAEACFNVSAGHNVGIRIANESNNVVAYREANEDYLLSLCSIITNNKDSRLNMLVRDANADSAQSISDFTLRFYEIV